MYCIYFVLNSPGTGLAINCMSVNETFCVMGSDDGYLRLWPLDFEHVYLEAGKHLSDRYPTIFHNPDCLVSEKKINFYMHYFSEHEGPVTAVDFSADGMKILAGTSTVS